MAQVNISFLSDIPSNERRQFALAVRTIVAKAVHGLQDHQILPDSVSVLVLPIDTATSLSGADVEVQVLVSGNNWPLDVEGRPLDVSKAKKHFDQLALRILSALAKKSKRTIYVWVTPFTASGWAL